MQKRFTWLCAVTVFLFVLAPVAASASSATQTFELVLEVPNVAQAPNGDLVAVTGEGEFSVHPKSVEASGDFAHTDSEGNVIATGTWEALQLLDYQSYGCGVVFGEPLPPNFCGGKLMMRVLLTTPLGQLEGTLWVFCLIGPNPPNSAEEGIRLNVPGVINFNDVVTGENVYIRTS